MLLGLDIGTTGARAVLLEPDDGRVLGSGTSEYPLHAPRPLWAEQDPRAWWEGAVRAIRHALAEARETLGEEPEVLGVGLSGQMHGVCLLDGRGEPLGPALLWCDGRAGLESREIAERVGAERLIEVAANPALVGFSAPKLLWLRRHEPDLYARARKFLLPKDYVRYRLTGAFATDVSDASGTLLFDVPRRRWSEEILEALDLDPALLPEVHESPEVTATVSRTAAEETGLPVGVPVVGGGGDQAAGAVGAGIVHAGLVSVTLGSSGVVFAHADRPLRDPQGRVHTFCHAVPGAWHVMGVTQGAGLSLRWFRDEIFGTLEVESARLAGVDPYDALTDLAGEAPPGCEGLLFLPYLMGERTPHLDPHARGVFCGLTAAHRRSHLARAVLEGVAFSLRDCAEILREMGLPMEEVRVAGGGARSALWRRIQADVLGREVATLEAAEGPAYGAALLAGVGTGFWPGVAEACRCTVRLGARTGPRNADVYDHLYPLYRELYGRLAPLFPRLEALGSPVPPVVP